LHLQFHQTGGILVGATQQGMEFSHAMNHMAFGPQALLI
jgi:hypothetical protein